MTAQREVDRRASRLATRRGIRRGELREGGLGYGQRRRGTVLELADVRDHRPDVRILVLVAERRHRGEAEAVLHDPEELRVGLAPCVLAREVARGGIRR